MTSSDRPLISRERAVEIAKWRGTGFVTADLIDAQLTGDTPVWVLTATTENYSESPYLANTIIRSARRITIDAITGKLLTDEFSGPEYIPDSGHPSRFVPKVWRGQITHSDRKHDILIYSIQVTSNRLGSARLTSHRIGYVPVVNGQEVSQEGYLCYLTYRDALAAAHETIKSDGR